MNCKPQRGAKGHYRRQLSNSAKNLKARDEFYCENVLELRRNLHENEFCFDMARIINGDVCPTVREMLRLIVVSVYEPTRFLALFTIKSRIILQDV